MDIDSNDSQSVFLLLYKEISRKLLSCGLSACLLHDKRTSHGNDNAAVWVNELSLN